MSEIADLMASNDPMATPVMSLGPSPPPPLNTSQDGTSNSNTAALHEKQIEQMSPLANLIPDQKKGGSKSHLSVDQKLSIVVSICAFIIMIPNVQQLLVSQLPVLTTNTTLHVVVNSALIGILFLYMKDHISDLL